MMTHSALGFAIFSRLTLGSALLIISACAASKPFEIDLMPAPDVYDDGAIDPFGATQPMESRPYQRILYATDRLPASDDETPRFYRNERGGALRLGAAQIEFVRADITWKEARRLSLTKNRTDKYPLRVSSIEEFGVLDRSAAMVTAPDRAATDQHAAAAAFAAAINAKLATSNRKHIYIYTHGYKVTFESPVLVATELWHFLGYDGVFIAYAWPATPSRWAYLRDIETAAGFARNLRIFLEYLAEETQAEQLHVVGYSAGTRLVTRALEQLALLNHERTADEIYAALHLDHVILIGSDVDRQVLGAYLADGLLKVPRHLSIYISEKDKALSLSRFLTRRERLGEMWTQHLHAATAEYLHRNEADLSVINVTQAEGAAVGNGHGYFRHSPWASSDILTTLAYDLRPADRGLVRAADSPIWTFPPDYIERLRTTLIRENPELVKATQKRGR